jgi:hypothetical protein
MNMKLEQLFTMTIHGQREIEDFARETLAFVEFWKQIAPSAFRHVPIICADNGHIQRVDIIQSLRDERYGLLVTSRQGTGMILHSSEISSLRVCCTCCAPFHRTAEGRFMSEAVYRTTSRLNLILIVAYGADKLRAVHWSSKGPEPAEFPKEEVFPGIYRREVENPPPPRIIKTSVTDMH